jgi:hypothetical protein
MTMARTALAVQAITRAGLTPAYTAANADGHAIANDGSTMLHVKTVGTACTVTVVTPGTVDGQAIADRTIALGTNTERMIGPFPPRTYNQDGAVHVDFSAVTAVTVAAVRTS